MSQYIHFNGETLLSSTPIIGADNRGFRYGDGLFETILVRDGQICLAHYHFDRLFTGLELLGLPCSLTADSLASGILALCGENGHLALARVRVTVFRGDGGLCDPTADRLAQYLIQSSAWTKTAPDFNGKGLTTGMFPDGRKSCDRYASLKSNNYLIYAMAAQYAQQHRWNDALLLNSAERISDSTIANLFYCKAGVIYTPPLSEGGIAGVMRRHLLHQLPLAGFTVQEKPTSITELEEAEEMFLTNALRGIQWVGSFRSTAFTTGLTRTICHTIFQDR